MIGQLIADQILERHGRARPIRAPTTRLERALHDMYGQTVRRMTDGDVESMLLNGLAVAQTSSSNAVANSSALAYMTQQQYNEMAAAFTAHPLPESLEHLTVRARLEGGSSLEATFLFALPCLQTLDLSYCSLNDSTFTTIGPAIGQRLPRLETLIMARNRLREAPLCDLLGPALRRVDLSYNPINCASAATLFGADSAALAEVDLQHTFLADCVREFPPSNRIATLHLGGCGISDAVFGVLGPSLARQTALQTLNLSRNALDSSPLGALIGPALASLDLSCNPITSRSASSLLAGLDGNAVLARIDLRNTSIAARGLEFERIRLWRASPAVLEMPHCFMDDETLWRMMAFVPVGVEVRMERMEAERMRICD